MKRYLAMMILLLNSLMLSLIAKSDTTYQLGELTYTIPYGYEPFSSFVLNNSIETDKQVKIYVNNEDQSLLILIYQDQTKNSVSINNSKDSVSVAKNSNVITNSVTVNSNNNSSIVVNNNNGNKNSTVVFDNTVNTGKNIELKNLVQELRDDYDQAVGKVKTFIIDWSKQLRVHNIEINQVYRYKINSKTPGFIALGTAELPNVGKSYLTTGFVTNPNYLLNVMTFSFSQNAETVGDVFDSLNE